VNAPARSGRLTGRTALITGASRGIGRAIALRYAEEGADLFLTATKLAQLEETQALAEAQGAQVTLHCADLGRQDEAVAMVDAAVAALGSIDILVNNAGVYKAARLVDTTTEDFDRIMRVNVYGVFHVMQRVLRHMQSRGQGKVVNIASTAGKWGSMNQSAYNASKHAVVGLTRCAALEEFRAHGDILGVPFEQVMEAGRMRVPLKRFLQPREIADLAVYLGSAESDGMTGQTLLLDGGMLMV
jgi:meso-butanediol dehydrogenase/(S,S)-butanediol dehydrogenase/diacetyl reductase